MMVDIYSSLDRTNLPMLLLGSTGRFVFFDDEKRWAIQTQTSGKINHLSGVSKVRKPLSCSSPSVSQMSFPWLTANKMTASRATLAYSSLYPPSFSVLWGFLRRKMEAESNCDQLIFGGIFLPVENLVDVCFFKVGIAHYIRTPEVPLLEQGH